MDFTTFTSKLVIVKSDMPITKGSIVTTSEKSFNKPGVFDFGYITDLDEDDYTITWYKNFEIVSTKVERAIKVLNAYYSAKFHYKSAKLSGDVWKYSYDVLTYILIHPWNKVVNFKVEPEVLRKRCKLGDTVTINDGIYIYTQGLPTIYGKIVNETNKHLYSIQLNSPDKKVLELTRAQFILDGTDTFKLVKILCPLCK
jgi:hypothetical protein